MAERNIAAILGREWQELLAGLEPARAGRPGIWLAEGAAGQPTTIQLFAEIEDARAEWVALIRSDGAKENAERLITSQWTLRELLAHTASWGREFRAEVELAARGGEFDYTILFEPGVGPTAWNHAEVEKRRRMTLDEIREEYEGEAERLGGIVLGMDDAKVVEEASFPLLIGGERPMLRSIGETVLTKCWHDRYHIGRIRDWLGRLEKGEVR